MPKVPLNFQNTVIYKIVCNDLNIEDVYVGHTTNFTKRKCSHKSASTNQNCLKYNIKIYKTIREHGGFENWSMIEIEKYPCNDLQEASKKERYYFELLNARLNMVNPSRSQKEYREINKDKIKMYKEKHKKHLNLYQDEYRENNLEKMRIYQTKYRASQKDIQTEYEIEQLELELSAIILKK